MRVKAQGVVIVSRQNERIKAVRALQERKARQASGCFLAEGIGLVGMAVQMGAGIELVVVCEELCQSEFGLNVLAELERREVLRIDVSADVFASITDDRSHGLVGVVRQHEITLKDIRPEGVWIALDAIQYPPNLGTILRTCDAVGASGVILLDASTDPFAPATVKASRGAIFTQQVVRCRLEEFAKWKPGSGFRVVGTSLEAKLDYTQADYASPLILIMGSERYGLQEGHLAVCDELVKIPMRGRCDSLNVAVAASLVLYETVRTR